MASDKVRGALVVAAVIFGAILMTEKTVSSIRARVASALSNRNVRAFLDMIARFESGGRYDIIYGGQKFADFSQHPNIRVPFFNPATQKNDYSTAAGRYQITKPTYTWVAPLIGVKDFSSVSQDALAVALLYKVGALDMVERGDFNGALLKASGTWASLPHSTSGQSKTTIQSALNSYVQAGGQIA